MSAASVIERASSNGALESFVGYAFCLKLKVNTVLQSLVWQIVQNRHLTTDQKLIILEAYRSRRIPSDHTTQTERQETSDLCNLIAKLLQSYDSVTLLFDGVDQVTSPEGIVACISIIADTLLRYAKPFKLLITSRQPPRGLQRISDQLGLQILSLTSRDVISDTEICIRQSLINLEPPLNVGADTLVIQKCLEEAENGWPYFMYALATDYVKLGRPNEAEGLVMKVLSFREARLQEDSTPIINTKRLLAWIMAEQGRRGEAEELQRSLLEVCKQTRGEGNNYTRLVTNDLSLTLSHRDATPEKRREAIILLEQLVLAWQTPQGDKTEQWLAAANNLAVAYMEVDRLEEAEALMSQVIAESALLHGGNGHVSLEHKSNLAQLLARQQKWAEAEVLDLEVLETRKRTLGEDDPTTIRCMSSLGWAYSKQGRLQEAKELQLQVLERRTRVQGPTHPDTISILGNLAETLSKLGDKKGAQRYARMALGY